MTPRFMTAISAIVVFAAVMPSDMAKRLWPYASQLTFENLRSTKAWRTVVERERQRAPVFLPPLPCNREMVSMLSRQSRDEILNQPGSRCPSHDRQVIASWAPYVRNQQLGR